MKFREIFRFEFSYQMHRLPTWLYFIVVAGIAFMQIRGNYLADALYDDFFINSPFIIAMVTVFGSVIWLLIGASVAGEAAARDVQTGMYSLTYTSPLKKHEYLSGRFLAALLVNAFILLGVPVGIMLAVYLPGVDAQVVGPFRAVGYITAYLFIALPAALITTAFQFMFAALNSRIKAAYLGSMIVFISAYILSPLVSVPLGQRELGRLLDPIGIMNVVSKFATEWTPAEKSTRLVSIEGALSWNRVLWISIAVIVLAITQLKFRFAYRVSTSWWKRWRRKDQFRINRVPAVRSAITIPNPPRTFGAATRLRQSLAIAWTSFRVIAKSWNGLFLWALIAGLIMLAVPLNLDVDGVPLVPRTDYLVTILAAPFSNALSPWVIIPLMIMLYAGELVWREREAGMSEITDAAGVPDWVLFIGKFSGLALALVVWMASLVAATMLAQSIMGYKDSQPGLLVQVFLGFQLVDYLLFALLAMMVQVLVNHKYIGHLMALVMYVIIGLSAQLGIEHHLLVYASGPRWSYTEMRGFGASLGPWLWFKLYWISWALLLAVITRLFWMRSKEADWRVRLQLARHRFNGATAGIGITAIALIIAMGGYIFYNTNVLNEYRSSSALLNRQAEYERRYGQYKTLPQPQISDVKLQVEIYPEQRKADIKGSYLLINNTTVPIDSIHIENAAPVKTSEITFNKRAAHAVNDDELRHHIYVLSEPLQPGDSVQMNFVVHFERSGFTNYGINSAVISNGTYFTSEDWLPIIGYQWSRELLKPTERRKYGLPARPLVASPYEIASQGDGPGSGRMTVETVIGTNADEMAVAPGTLQQTWTKNDRRYFSYATGTAIGSEYALFSAKYDVRKEQWQSVAIQVFYHPTHNANVERIVKSAKASLEYYSKQYGAYPHNHLSFVEHPGLGQGMHAEPAMITMQEGFSLFNPDADKRSIDLPYAVVGHEVAHQWWGGLVAYAPVQGAGMLTESPAWYSSMRMINATYGAEHLQRLVAFMRQPYPIIPIRPAVPLLRALDPYGAYRRGPFALHALTQYMGEERVNLAYKHLAEKYGTSAAPLATSLDLYRELKLVTPDSLQTLLHDLFEANTFWDFKAERVAAVQTGSAWKITLDVRSRKTVLSESGAETELPMDEWVEIGVYDADGKTLYLQKHKIHSGKQTITVTVAQKPGRAGIDPNDLLWGWERKGNVKDIKLK